MMLARWRACRRGAGIVLAAGLAVVALGAVLAAVATARPLDFVHVRTNLSRAASRVSAYPDLAVGPDGHRVAVVWTEGYTDVFAYKGHVYLRAASEMGGGWGRKISVFAGGDSACAYDAAVAVTGTTAHVAYIVFSDTCQVPSQMQVRHQTCFLDRGQCDGSEYPVASIDTSDGSIIWVDLALDASGNPHVVWAQYNFSKSRNAPAGPSYSGADGGFFPLRGSNYDLLNMSGDGDIIYRAHNGSGWDSVENVALSDDNNKPAIAWADGYVHLVWEEQTQHIIQYRRRGTSGWEPSMQLGVQQPDTGPPGNPDVAAGRGRVFVVWDWCSDATCKKYHVVYRRSNDSGSSWDGAREVGTDNLVFSQEYSSSDDVFVRGPYLAYLQPSIALNGDGWPVVVWHADRSSGGMGTDYAIYYSYALAGDVGSVDWEIPPTVLNRGRPSMLGSAVVGVGEPEPGGEQHLHAAYMGELGTDLWDVYYDSNEWDRYQHFYLPVTMRE